MLTNNGIPGKTEFDQGMFYFRNGQYKEAIPWFEKADHCGNFGGSYYLGLIYLSGNEEVQPNRQQAIELIKKSAGMGNFRAQQLIEQNYQLPSEKKVITLNFQPSRFRDQSWKKTIFNQAKLSITEKSTEAVASLKKLAEEGYFPACDLLGDLYFRGEVLEKNVQEAVFWYSKGAQLGNWYSQIKLGDIYLNGVGVDKNPAEATKYYEMAVDSSYQHPGRPNHLCVIGKIYLEGIGVEKNLRKACLRFLEAAQKGSDVALELLSKIRPEIENNPSLDDIKTKWFSLTKEAPRNNVVSSKAAQKEWAYFTENTLTDNAISGETISLVESRLRALLSISNPVNLTELGQDLKSNGKTVPGLLKIIVKELGNYFEVHRDYQSGAWIYQKGTAPEKKTNKPFNLIDSLKSLKKDKDEWINQSNFGQLLKASGINIEELGYSNLTLYLRENFGQLLEFSGPPIHIRIKKQIRPQDTISLITRASSEKMEDLLQKELEKAQVVAQQNLFGLISHTSGNTLLTGLSALKTVFNQLKTVEHHIPSVKFSSIAANYSQAIQAISNLSKLISSFRILAKPKQEIISRFQMGEGGGCNIKIVLASAFLQALSIYVFDKNLLISFNKMLAEKGYSVDQRKLFKDSLLSLQLGDENTQIDDKKAEQIFSWIDTINNLFTIEIDDTPEVVCRPDGFRFLIFTSIFLETIFNALKYSDKSYPIAIFWKKDHSGYRFIVSNYFNEKSQISSGSSQLGQNFLNQLKSNLNLGLFFSQDQVLQKFSFECLFPLTLFQYLQGGSS